MPDIGQVKGSSPLVPKPLSSTNPPEEQTQDNQATSSIGSDGAQIEVRPQAETVADAVARAKAAQAVVPQSTVASDAEAEQEHQRILDEQNAIKNNPVKQGADWFGNIDGSRGVANAVAKDIPEFIACPPSIIPRILQRFPSIANGLTQIANSKPGTWSKATQSAVKNFMEAPKVKPVVKLMGRIAPFAGAVVAGFDINSTLKTLEDPTVSPLKKGVSVVRTAFSSIAAVAGIAELIPPVAPVAGAISFATSLVSMGLDFALGFMK